MQILKKASVNKKIVMLSISILIFVILFVFSSVQNIVNGSIHSVFQRITGEKEIDSTIVLITINDNDIQVLGGWPIKRSYYALLINKLHEANVKKIGIEIFFSETNNNQKIYNSLLTKEIEKENNIKFGSLVNGLSFDDEIFFAKSIQKSEIAIEDTKAQIAHLNYIEDENEIIIPNNIVVRNTTIPSLAYSLTESKSTEQRILNTYSSFKKFRQYSIIQFINVIENNPNFKKTIAKKIVLIGVSDLSISKSISTIFDKRLPGIGIHAIQLDNLITNRGLIRISNISHIFLFMFFVIFAIIFIRHGGAIIYPILLLLFFAISFLLFYNFYLLLNYAFFVIPIVMLGLFELLLKVNETVTERDTAVASNRVLYESILQREKKLNELELELQKSSSPPKALVNEIESLKKEINANKESQIKNGVPFELSDKEEIFEGIVFKSDAIAKIISVVKKVAPTDATVLIVGESGSGKELIANAIHKHSKRSNKKFVSFNCAAISDSLLESELFGHVKGAFTDASKDNEGRFKLADKGTIFLDEIGETSEKFQSKILRVLQSGELQRIGSSENEIVDVRVIAATNKDLSELISEKKFREDLYYRLKVITIEMPPLNKRKEDVPLLANYFAQKDNPDMKISEAVMDLIIEYNWPGNVRELEAFIKRALIFAKSENRKMIQLTDIPEEFALKSDTDIKTLVLTALRDKGFSHSAISETAKELGNISRTIVAENLRGIFFENYYKANFDFDSAIKKIANTENPITIKRISKKGEIYLNNIIKDISNKDETSFEMLKEKFSSKYKNLPQKYHFYLDNILRHLLSQ